MPTPGIGSPSVAYGTMVGGVMNMSHLEVRRISKSYDHSPILHQVSFDVEEVEWDGTVVDENTRKCMGRP